MKKKPLACIFCGQFMTKDHDCQKHDHDRKACEACMDMWSAGWQDACKTEPIPEKEIIREPYWYKVMIALAIGLVCGWITGLSYPLWQPPAITPFVVYRPNKETDKKLADCQSDWKSDQVEKKVLKAKLSSCQDYLWRSAQ